MSDKQKSEIVKSLLKIWAIVEYDYEDKSKTIRAETMNALSQLGFVFK